MNHRSWDGVEDLAEVLRGRQGARVRAEILQHLQTLESALAAQAVLGAAPEAYADLQAALLAVRAGADTLRQLDVPEVQQGSSPLIDRRPFLSGGNP